MKLLLLATIFCLAFGSHHTLPAVFLGQSDEVTTLPGLHFKLHFKHYSGYLASTNNSQLHYWFFESQNDPANDPVVLWLNGGPGCSSILGALTENGPIQLNADGSLSPNANPWTARASVIYLESPAGVGFSYNLDQNYKTNDDATAILNYEALKSFYKKFPHLADNDFYIAGESYGGVYIPTLSRNVLQGGAIKNFRGFAIGNGLLDQTLLGNSYLHFTYNHGLYSKQLWDEMVANCCQGVADTEKCDFVNSQAPACIKSVSTVQNLLNSIPLNPYNIYSDCVQTTGVSGSASSKSKITREEADRRMVRKYLLKHADQTQLGDNPTCVDLDFVGDYLNQKSVRSALHINSQSEEWAACSPAVGNSYTNQYQSLTEMVRYLLNSGLKGLIYNGDVDTVCNFLGDQWFAEGLGFATVQDYQPWYFNKQIGGFYKIYENFGFATVRGSGHTVPMDKPAQAKEMFYRFVDMTKSK